MTGLAGCLDLLYKAFGTAVGALTLYITVKKLFKAEKGKRKRNASNHDVPK